MLNIARKRVIVWFIPIMVSMFVSGCGTEGDPILGQPNDAGYAPKVVAVTPVNNEINVSYNIKHITAEFSLPMDPTTLTLASFTLFDVNTSTPVATTGTVEYEDRVADLTLEANLNIHTVYNATITTAAKDMNGVALSSDYVWKFTTGETADETRPEVNSTSPIKVATGVSLSKTVTATFSEPMKALSVTAAGTFTLKETVSTNGVDGAVTYAVINKTASFNPTDDLELDMNYTATIKNTVADLAGNTMLNDYNWTFKTEAAPQPPLVNFKLAAPFGIASTAGVTNSDTVDDKTWIDGDVILNPTYTCNENAVPFGGTFGDCGGMAPELTFGHEVITAIYPNTTDAPAITADLRAAYISLRDMTADAPIDAPTSLGGATGLALSTGVNRFLPGVYKSGISIDISGDLTLDGNNEANPTFVFQAGTSLTTASNTRILLINGAKASNVYWQVGSSATLGVNTVWNGNTLAYASISMNTGATSCGRLFAGAFTDGAFTFLSNDVAVPGNSALLVGCE